MTCGRRGPGSRRSCRSTLVAVSARSCGYTLVVSTSVVLWRPSIPVSVISVIAVIPPTMARISLAFMAVVVCETYVTNCGRDERADGLTSTIAPVPRRSLAFPLACPELFSLLLELLAFLPRPIVSLLLFPDLLCTPLNGDLRALFLCKESGLCRVLGQVSRGLNE